MIEDESIRWADAAAWVCYEDGEITAWRSTEEHRRERQYNPRKEP